MVTRSDLNLDLIDKMSDSNVLEDIAIDKTSNSNVLEDVAVMTRPVGTLVF